MSAATLLEEAPAPAVVPPFAPSPVGRPAAATANAAGCLLELPEIRARVWRMPVEVYERLAEQGVGIPKRVELLRGILVEKVVKSALHRRLARTLFVKFLSIAPSGCTAFTEAPLRLADSEPEPDVMVVRGEVADFDAVHPASAELVVEVAVTSLAADREMAFIYAEVAVPEYWIVIAPEEIVEVYRRPANGVYQEVRRFARGETLACGQLPELSVAVDELFG